MKQLRLSLYYIWHVLTQQVEVVAIMLRLIMSLYYICWHVLTQQVEVVAIMWANVQLYGARDALCDAFDVHNLLWGIPNFYCYTS